MQLHVQDKRNLNIYHRYLVVSLRRGNKALSSLKYLTQAVRSFLLKVTRQNKASILSLLFYLHPLDIIIYNVTILTLTSYLFS